MRTLTGHVGGGCDLSFGTLDIEIKTEDGCFDTTLFGLSQNYEVLMPAQAYLAEVTDVHVGGGSGLDPVDVENIHRLHFRRLLGNAHQRISVIEIGPLDWLRLASGLWSSA